MHNRWSRLYPPIDQSVGAYPISQGHLELDGVCRALAAGSTLDATPQD